MTLQSKGEKILKFKKYLQKYLYLPYSKKNKLKFKPEMYYMLRPVLFYSTNNLMRLEFIFHYQQTRLDLVARY